MEESNATSGLAEARIIKRIWELVSLEPEIVKKLTPLRRRQLDIILKNEKRTHNGLGGETPPVQKAGDDSYE
jgi:hypothetical protein